MEDTKNFIVPAWLTGKFLEKNLQNHYKNNDVKVINFEVKPIATSGECYTSTIHRVKVTISNDVNNNSILNLVIKNSISETNTFEKLLLCDVYSKEREFYAKIVPKINDKLKFLGEPKLFPEYFGMSELNNILILEDLSIEGYKVLPRSQGYNIPEAKAILKRMATFHAICAAVQEEHPDIFANFTKGLKFF